MKKIVSRFVPLLILCSLLVSLPKINIAKAESRTIVVPDDYLTIGWAIGNASEGDTIFVKKGIYYETPVVDKSISLIGENRYNTVIDGNYTDVHNVIEVTASNVKISGFTIQKSEYRNCGIYVGENSRSNNISYNIITNNSYVGIWLYHSSGNRIVGNNITNNGNGITLGHSSNNIISGNNITNNDYGISIHSSSNNVLRNNHMNNNKVNFGVSGGLDPSVSAFVNDVDTSNTVDGKSIYYWVNERDRAVPSDAGYVALVKCTNITVKNLSLKNNGQGVLLAYTTNSKIIKNNITNDSTGITLLSSSNNTISENNITANNGDGIYLYSSSNNRISGNRIANNGNGIVLGSYSNYNSVSGNNIANNGFGIHLWDSSNNSISGNNVIANRWGGIYLHSSSNNSVSGNNVTNHSEGIHILSSSNNSVSGNNLANNDICITLASYSNYNSISGNNITENSVGISLWYSSNNLFFHNYFINNTQQVSIPKSGYANFWDNGVEGNYWSDYEDRYPNATELDDSGILDTPYVIDADNQDRYPLIPYWFPPTISIVSPENKTYTVNTFSLTFTINELTSWMGYSLDGQANVTITGNTTLTRLSDGSHSLVVYAKDTYGYTGASEKIYFSIKTESFPTTWIAATIVIIAVVGVALLVYFAKIRKTTGKVEQQQSYPHGHQCY